MKKSFIILLLSAPLFSCPAAFAVETAPRISDREIIEGLSTIRGDVKELRATIRGDVNELRAEIKRLDEGQKASVNELRATISGSVNELRATISGNTNELRTEIKRSDEGQKTLEKRFDDMNHSVNRRFDILQWMLGLFITVAISLMGIMGRILWSQQKRLTQIETTLEAQKEEISFIKALIEKLQSLIEKLLPPRSVL